ncbi:MAG: hypothetical protein ACXVCO_00305 [Ktedonobacterales bacterium]
MALGTDYAQNSNGFYITHPQNTFTNSDQFAYAINLDRPIGTTRVDMLLVKLQSGGAESVVYSIPVPISDPSYSTFANRLSAQDLMAGNPPGTYKLEMSNGSSILAKATFTYKG